MILLKKKIEKKRKGIGIEGVICYIGISNGDICPRSCGGGKSGRGDLRTRTFDAHENALIYVISGRPCRAPPPLIS
jgi:hypothetical protein